MQFCQQLHRRWLQPVEMLQKLFFPLFNFSWWSFVSSSKFWVTYFSRNTEQMNLVYSLSELCSRVLLPPFSSLEFHFVGLLGYSGWLSVARYQDFSWENYFPLWHICALTHRKVETWNWTNVGQKEINKIWQGLRCCRKWGKVCQQNSDA